jgi:hypothetical protein
MAVFMTQILSQWNNYFPFYSMSSNDFYTLVEEIIKEHEYPNVRISRTTHKETGIFSSSREYLRVKYRDLVFDICAAPFGKDFYVSWWLYETESAMRVIFKYTKIGDFLRKRAAKKTFYEADISAIFRSSVHSCVMQAVEHITNSTGHRLSESEKQIHIGAI